MVGSKKSAATTAVYVTVVVDQGKTVVEPAVTAAVVDNIVEVVNTAVYNPAAAVGLGYRIAVGVDNGCW
jgi:hypothetical protein